LSVCASQDCAKRLDPWHLEPGETGAVNVEVNGGYGPAIVTSPSGLIVGCLPFRLSKRPPAGFVTLTSSAVPCGTSGGVAAADGKDWPDPTL